MVPKLAFILALVLVSCAGPTPKARAAQSPSTPNILFILADDMRWDQLQYMPLTLARLGSRGVRFEQSFVASPVCGPSRVSLLSGQYVHTHGVRCNDDSAANFHGRTHLGLWLQEAGYRTGYFGKWLNGTTSADVAPWPYVAAGWHDWRAFVEPGGYEKFSLIENGTVKKYAASIFNTPYSTTVLAQHARTFIASTPADQPFFAMFTPKAPHAPFTPETDADRLFGASTEQPRPPSWNEADVSDKHPYMQALPLLTEDEQKLTRQTWRRQVGTLQSVDRAIAQLWDDLAASGRLNDTVIIFTSDNGHLGGEHRLDKGKGCPYEECIRSPLIVSVPGQVARVDSTHLISALDLPATIVTIANVTPPYELPGMNLLPLLANPSSPWRETVLIEYLSTVGERPPFDMVVTATERYAEYQDGSGFKEFYNVSADPAQLLNRPGDARAAVLAARLAVLRAQ